MFHVKHYLPHSMLLELESFKSTLFDIENMSPPLNIVQLKAYQNSLIHRIKSAEFTPITSSEIDEILISNQNKLASYSTLIAQLKVSFTEFTKKLADIPSLIKAHEYDAQRWLLQAHDGQLSAEEADFHAMKSLEKAKQLYTDFTATQKELKHIRVRVSKQVLLYQERKYTYNRLLTDLKTYSLLNDFMQIKRGITSTLQSEKLAQQIQEAIHNLASTKAQLTIQLNTLIYAQLNYLTLSIRCLKNAQLPESVKDRTATDFLKRKALAHQEEKLIRVYRNLIKKSYQKFIHIAHDIEFDH